MPTANAHHAESVSTSTSTSTSRPRSDRVKFLCSHGGNILPNPADGRLKYVGGDTRIISVHRHITFHELMKKLASMYNGEMILKYQLTPEDLEVLVTVKSDEDIRHMVEECDRHERVGAPRLRTFIFPASPVVTVNSLGPIDSHLLQQRYINDIVVHPHPLPITDPSYSTFTISSACSLPSTLHETSRTKNHEFNSYHGKHSLLTRNHSSPSLCNTGSPDPKQHHQQHHGHLQPHVSPLDRHAHKTSGPEHLSRMRPTGAAEHYKLLQMGHKPSHNHMTDKRGHVYYQRGPLHDDRYGQTDSHPSPDVPSSSHGMRSRR